MPKGPANDQRCRGGASCSCSTAAHPIGTATKAANARLTMTARRACSAGPPLALGARGKAFAQYRFRDRVGQRLRRLEQAEQRQDDEQEDEIIRGEYPRRDHVSAL